MFILALTEGGGGGGGGITGLRGFVSSLCVPSCDSDVLCRFFQQSFYCCLSFNELASFEKI